MASKQLQIFSTAICKGDRKGEPVRSDGRAKGSAADTTRPDRAKGITMQQRANINKPLRVKAIYLKGNNKPLLDRIVWIYYNFLVVAENENDYFEKLTHMMDLAAKSLKIKRNVVTRLLDEGFSQEVVHKFMYENPARFYTMYK